MANQKSHGLPGIVSKFITLFADVMFELSKVLLLFVMVIIVYEVVARYIFADPTIWVVDVSRYSLVYITFLAAPALLLRGGHVNVDLVLTHLPTKGRLILGVIGYAISAASLFIIFLFSTAATWENYVRKTLVIDPIEIPKWIPLAIIPVGLCFLCLACIVKIGREWSELRVLSTKEVDQ